MRKALTIVAAALACVGCGHKDQTDKTQNVDENLAAENIVSNDVTAIDAVTGDASNMAADMNYQEFDNSDNGPDTGTAKPSRPRKSAPASSAAVSSSTSNSSATSATPAGNAAE